ncbi:alcohol oxidase [Pholiota conissans]|uniref:pyranose dehydrogenase (acceptor) n=1 Tax=Pholiota conissans TaxID=109636 RepID=A0A9P5YWI5_9AGAR|nr:alcohol oxidase [Pholiota conissans]
MARFYLKFAALFALIGSSLCALYTDPSQLPSTTTYDYIIVGAGTAGNVIASRLTEDPLIQVLVLEAGVDDANVQAAIAPFLAPSLTPGTIYDWGYNTVAQSNLNNRVLPYPRGKILGGSSTANYMIHQYGSSEDWDKIAADTGNVNWSWNNIKQYIPVHEKMVAPTDGHDTTGQYIPGNHGTNGKLGVSLPGNSQTIDAKVIATTSLLTEFPFNPDTGGGSVLGIGWAQSSIAAGVRTSSSTGYLRPVLSRPNLSVVLNATVRKLIPNAPVNGLPSFNGVQFGSFNGPAFLVFATREIVLSAGSIGTPQILLLSGVGPTADLSALSIPTIINNPSVGKNLSDHLLLPNNFIVSGTDTLDDVARGTTFAAALSQWVTSKTGVIANTVANHLGFLRLPSTASIFTTVPDPSTGPTASHWELVVSNFFLNPAVAMPSTGNYLTVSSIVISPTSRGTVKLASIDPFAAPIINPNFLSTTFDVFCLREAVKAVKRFVAASPWANWVTGPYGALAATSDDASIDSYVRSTAGSIYHPVGTASMTSNTASYGVVNPDLRLKGAVGVRIADASVLPTLPNGHTQGPVYLLAERAAMLIKAAQ